MTADERNELVRQARRHAEARDYKGFEILAPKLDGSVTVRFYDGTKHHDMTWRPRT